MIRTVDTSTVPGYWRHGRGQWLVVVCVAMIGLGGHTAGAQAPPAQVSIADSPDDPGHALTVSFLPSPTPGVIGYAIERRPAGGDWERVQEVVLPPEAAGRHVYVDATEAIPNGVDYTYRVATVTERGQGPWGQPSNAAAARGQWFHRGRAPMFLCILALSLAIAYFIVKARSGRDVYLRPIPGLKAFEEGVGRATEMGKPVLFVPGIMDLDQVETVAGVIILGHVAKMTARYEAPLKVPVSRSLVMEASREVCRESYLSEGRPDLFHDDMVHYLTDDQFAYAAGVDGIMLREKPATCFYQGKFYAESLILAETGNSIGAIQVAGTGSPAQIPFFVTACDYTLIGEEFFAASAYLSEDAPLVGSLKGQDVGKLLVMLAVLLGVALETLAHLTGNPALSIRDWFVVQ